MDLLKFYKINLKKNREIVLQLKEYQKCQKKFAGKKYSFVRRNVTFISYFPVYQQSQVNMQLLM